MPLLHLRAAREALEQGQRERALEALLEAWRACRAPEIAGLVERLGELIDSKRPPLAVAGHKSLQQAWVAAAERAGPADLGQLYAVLIDTRPSLAHARLACLRDSPPDPRLATLLMRYVREVCFPGPGGRGFFIEVIRQLSTIDDPRYHDELRELAARYKARTIVGLRRVGQVAVKPLIALGRELEGRDEPPALADDAGELCAAIAPLLEPGQAERRDERSEEDLLAAVFAAPADDAPRLVYADRLLERGDERGELINLQCSRQAGEKPSRREKALLKRYSDALVGELLPFVLKGGRVFRRGFLAACRYRNGRLDRDPHGLEAWATVEELDVSPHVFVSGAYDLIVQPQMRSLRAVRGLSREDFLKLARHPEPLRLEALHLRWGDPVAVVKALERCSSLPHLRSLDLRSITGFPPELAGRLRAALPLDELLLP